MNGIVFVFLLCVCILSGWIYNFFNFECVLYVDLLVSVKDNSIVVLDWGGLIWGKLI